MGRAMHYRPTPGELQARRVDKAAPHSTHEPGWPHLDKRGNCLCLRRCCIGPGGCTCETCSHQSHPVDTPTTTATCVTLGRPA